MIRDFFHTLSCTMFAAAPQTVAPAADQEQTIQKTPARRALRGSEAGFHRLHYDFHGSGVNPVDSWLFQQSQNIQKNRIFFGGLVYIQLNAKMPCVQVV